MSLTDDGESAPNPALPRTFHNIPYANDGLQAGAGRLIAGPGRLC
jgi:hypothetical protein